MNKYLVRFVSLLLVPYLVADPSTVSAFTNTLGRLGDGVGVSGGVAQTVFNEQALNPPDYGAQYPAKSYLNFRTRVAIILIVSAGLFPFTSLPQRTDRYLQAKLTLKEIPLPAPPIPSHPGLPTLDTLQDIVKVNITPLPKNVDYRLYRLNTTLPIYYIQFRNNLVWFDYFRRVYYYYGKSRPITASDAAMTWEQIQKAHPNNKSPKMSGADYTYVPLNFFVNAYNAYAAFSKIQRAPYRPQEIAFLVDLQKLGMITKVGDYYAVLPGSSLVMVMSKDPEGIPHELDHTLYDHVPAFKAEVWRIWEKVLTADERRAFLDALDTSIYSTRVDNLVVEELSAYAQEGFPTGRIKINEISLARQKYFRSLVRKAEAKYLPSFLPATISNKGTVVSGPKVPTAKGNSKTSKPAVSPTAKPAAAADHSGIQGLIATSWQGRWFKRLPNHWFFNWFRDWLRFYSGPRSEEWKYRFEPLFDAVWEETGEALPDVSFQRLGLEEQVTALINRVNTYRAKAIHYSHLRFLDDHENQFIKISEKNGRRIETQITFGHPEFESAFQAVAALSVEATRAFVTAILQEKIKGGNSTRRQSAMTTGWDAATEVHRRFNQAGLYQGFQSTPPNDRTSRGAVGKPAAPDREEVLREIEKALDHGFTEDQISQQMDPPHQGSLISNIRNGYVIANGEMWIHLQLALQKLRQPGGPTSYYASKTEMLKLRSRLEALRQRFKGRTISLIVNETDPKVSRELVVDMLKENHKHTRVRFERVQRAVERLEQWLEHNSFAAPALQLRENQLGILFPATSSIGPQTADVAQELYRNSAAARVVYDQVAHQIACSVQDLFPDRDREPTFKLLGSVLYSIALYRAIEEKLGRPLKPMMFSGNSGGMFAAIVLSGSVSLKEMVLYLVDMDTLRKRLVPQVDYAVFVLQNCEIDQIKNLLHPGQVEVLQDAHPAFISLAVRKTIDVGDLERRIITRIGSQNVRRIDVPAWQGGHTTFYPEAPDALRQIRMRVHIRQPQMAIYSPSLRKVMRSPGEIAQELDEGVVTPVWWTDTIQEMRTEGVNRFVEVGAGSKLADLNKTLSPDVPTISVNDLAAAQFLVERVLLSIYKVPETFTAAPEIWLPEKAQDDIARAAERGIRFTFAGPEDWEVVRLLRNSISSLKEGDSLDQHLPEFLARNALPEADAFILLAKRGDTILGQTYCALKNDGIVQLGEMAVPLTEREHGLGTALVAEAMMYAAQRWPEARWIHALARPTITSAHIFREIFQAEEQPVSDPMPEFIFQQFYFGIRPTAGPRSVFKIPLRRLEAPIRASQQLQAAVETFAGSPTASQFFEVFKRALPELARLSLGGWNFFGFNKIRLIRLRQMGGFEKGYVLKRDMMGGEMVSIPDKLVRDDSITLREQKYGIKMQLGVDYKIVEGDEFISALRQKLREETKELLEDVFDETAFFTQAANLVQAMLKLLDLQGTPPADVKDEPSAPHSPQEKNPSGAQRLLRRSA